MGAENAFVDLRRLVDWFATLDARSRTQSAASIERVALRLGATCVPLLGRELRARDPRRREAARDALARVAIEHRERVIDELRAVAASDACDEGKVCALGLLSELGSRGAASFADPSGIQRRSALALAAQLETAADIAAAADMMIRSLGDDALVGLLGVMADAAPAAAYRLGAELAARLDVDGELRERVADVALADPAPAPLARDARPAHVHVLVDASGRLVVIASRKHVGERRWRRWAVLIDARGHVEDCVHEDRAGEPGERAPLVATLLADGFAVAGDDVEHARALVAAAARLAADEPSRLTSAYYLGRDLLDLGEAHLGGRTHAHPISTTLGRAIDLVEAGEHARAQALLARCDRGDPTIGAEVAAASAACLAAAGHHADAIAQLQHAVDAEPDFPLHHWNLAAACHQLGDPRGCYHALRRFVVLSATPTGLYADPEQPSRVALAERLMADLERSARLAGTPLQPRRRRRTTRRTAVRK